MPYKDKDQQREYQRLWMQRRRDSFFSGKICESCGSVKDLQLDHRDPRKKVSHRIWSWSADRREAEVDKCQVLCTTCHKLKTRSDWSSGVIEPRVTIPDRVVEEIREKYRSGKYSYRQLAELYEVGFSHVGYLVREERRRSN